MFEFKYMATSHHIHLKTVDFESINMFEFKYLSTLHHIHLKKGRCLSIICGMLCKYYVGRMNIYKVFSLYIYIEYV